jgi:nucleoside-diphosphate-sugar epimerase
LNLLIKMKFFVTGHTGFVGNYFLSQLQPNDEIILHQKYNNFNLETCEVVLHFAGKAHDLMNSSNPQEYYDVNTELTKKLFNSFLTSSSFAVNSFDAHVIFLIKSHDLVESIY